MMWQEWLWANAKPWFRDHREWIAVTVITVGSMAFGYSFAAMNYQGAISANRAVHAADVREIANGYREALATKDQIIANISKQSLQAAVTANTAANTANTAAETAQAAAVTAAKAAKDKQ